ncbi:hypothetical protein L8O12_04145 [Enterobacter kobei]|uniref:hypothetical protein n=1 Tax=Enterobacter kobei TaxID=208224 RepID=UPI0020043B1B|nr:hypothetical protein [Enterobacter kobei]MCK7154648.1 hypothetical protein [Enterobacter kobei]
MMPVPPIHTRQKIKLMAVVHRLQQIMVNENQAPAELVGCAETVRDNHGRLYDISNQKMEAFTPVKVRIIPPPRRP